MGAKGTSFLIMTGICTYFATLAAYLAKIISASRFDFASWFFVLLFLWVIYERGVKTEKHIRRATKNGRVLVYIPLFQWWGRILLRLFGARINFNGKRIWEIHVNHHAIKNMTAKDIMQAIEKDLDRAASEHIGDLFVWESRIKPPKSYREKIKLKQEKRTAYLANRQKLPAVRRALLTFFSLPQSEIRKAPTWIGVFVSD